METIYFFFKNWFQADYKKNIGLQNQLLFRFGKALLHVKVLN